MISAQLLNPDAQLNEWTEQSSIQYVPGENLRVVVQILKQIEGIRFIPPITATLTATFTNADETQLIKTMTVLDEGDRSIWYVDLSQEETTNIASGNFLLKLDMLGDGTLIYLTSIQNGLQRFNLSGDCC